MTQHLLDQFGATFRNAPLWLEQILLIALFFFVAWIVYRLAPRLARRIVRLQRVAPVRDRLRPERLTTLSGLITSTIAVLAFVVAGLVSLSLFVNTNTLIWVIGKVTKLKLQAKARFGTAADSRPRLLALVQERPAEAGIELVS